MVNARVSPWPAPQSPCSVQRTFRLCAPGTVGHDGPDLRAEAWAPGLIAAGSMRGSDGSTVEAPRPRDSSPPHPRSPGMIEGDVGVLAVLDRQVEGVRAHVLPGDRQRPIRGEERPPQALEIRWPAGAEIDRSEEHTSELQSRGHL